MPIFEYACSECGAVSEFLVGVTSDAETPHCRSCGSKKVEKQFSAHAAPARTSATEGPACASASSCPHASSCGCR